MGQLRHPLNPASLSVKWNWVVVGMSGLGKEQVVNTQSHICVCLCICVHVRARTYVCVLITPYYP